jgi:hypothetical protein
MTHRQECIAHCKEQLQNRSLNHVFEEKIFNHYYNKNNGAQGNAFLIGIKTADMMIEQYQPKPADLEFYNQFFD